MLIAAVLLGGLSCWTDQWVSTRLRDKSAALQVDQGQRLMKADLAEMFVKIKYTKSQI